MNVMTENVHEFERQNMEYSSNSNSLSVQLSGVFLQRLEPCAEWTRRLLVIKDGFLLYYPESEKKEFEQKKVLNLHPKGIVPLGNNEIERCAELKYPFCVAIRRVDLHGSIQIAMDSEYKRDKWIDALSQASRITWDNLQINDSFVQYLEKEGLRIAEEKQTYYQKFQIEVLAFQNEKQKNEALGAMTAALEDEKIKMEKLTQDLKEEYSKLKDELKETSLTMSDVSKEKFSLESTNSSLQTAIKSLEMDKLKIQHELTTTSSQSDILSKENESLNSRSEKLQRNLKQIEDETSKLLTEKCVIEDRLRDREITVTSLLEEKEAIIEHANTLKMSISDISKEKKTAETKLKEEMMGRLEAERKLREAELALDRLEISINGNVNDAEPRSPLEQKENNKDVQAIRSFFENLAFNKKNEAEKTLIMKNSFQASKKVLRKAQSLKYRPNQKSNCISASDQIDQTDF